MTFDESLKYLYTIAPPFHQVGAVAYKPGLDTMRQLMQALGLSPAHPFTHSPIIHVAGTNGKGSTSHLIAAALAASGKKVGLYTSPHLVSFCERVRVIQPRANSQEPKAHLIPEDYVARFVEDHQALIAELHPSFFEITTAMAFCWLAEQKVDVAVIEVGLGGLLDATNIVNPALTVITNIGYDHTDLLGKTLPEIARQKAGIMKPGVPCVIGETHPETEQVFIDHARECGILGEGPETTDCRLWFADQCGFLRKQRLRFAPECELKGDYQQKNLQTAYVALQVLRNYCSVPVTASAIQDGFAHVVQYTGLRGRWEILSHEPLTICDTGHNSHGVRTYVEQLRQLTAQSANPSPLTPNPSPLTPNRSLHIVFGMVADKDIDAVLQLLPEQASYYFTQPDSHRAQPAEALLHRWQAIHPQHNACRAFEYVAQALQAARWAAKKEDVIFIGGSNYVVGEAIKIMEN